jgi:membrane protease YdiL (CAAX protease family)
MSDGWSGFPQPPDEPWVPPRPDVPLPAPRGMPPPAGVSPVPGMPAPTGSDGVRPRSTWKWWEAILVFFVGLIVGGFVALPVIAVFGTGSNAATVASNVIGEVVPGGLLVLWLRTYHKEWKGAIGFPRRERLPGEVARGVGFGLALYLVIAFGVAAILTLVFEQASGKNTHTPEQLPHLSGIAIFWAALLALVVAPIVEELFFRGCLFRSLRDRHSFPLAAIVSAFCFGLVHYVPGPWQDTLLLMTIMVFTGLGLAWFYDRRGNIVASMAAHATFNLIGLILILSTR